MHSNARMFSNKSDTVLMQKARELAKEEHEDWNIVRYEGNLQVAKLMVAGCLRFVRVVHDDSAALWFPSIRDAREFPKNELSVSRTALYLEDVHWESEGEIRLPQIRSERPKLYQPIEQSQSSG